MAKTNTTITVISKISDKLVPQKAALVVIYGAELGRKYDLAENKLVVGRSSAADIQVDQESVSRHHAEIQTVGEAVEIEDLKSTNGTYVNDEAVEGAYTLRNGDLVKIGRTIFKYIAGGNIESAYHDEIYRLTTIDGLTQISNRRFFEESLEREVSRCHRYKRELSLVLMDIDHFKNVNDTHGHLAGDHVLKTVAAAIRGRVRREDIFARYGGEEFALLLPELDLEGARTTAEKTRKLVEDLVVRWEDKKLQVTISLGVTNISDTLSEASLLIKSADDRLYEAKAANRNCVRP